MTVVIEPRTAEHGEKMITVRVRFWTNKLGAPPGKVIPKTCHTRGMVGIQANEAHGIKSLRDGPIAFNSLEELPAAIEKVLKLSGVTLVKTR